MHPDQIPGVTLAEWVECRTIQSLTGRRIDSWLLRKPKVTPKPAYQLAW